MIRSIRFFFAFLIVLGSFYKAAHAQNGNVPSAVGFSQRGGLFPGPVAVELSCPTPDAKIRYTLDGNEPDSLSLLYDGIPLQLDESTVVRARATVDGTVYSATGTQSYLIGQSHTFPVVSLAFEPAAFFDSLTGIYTNFMLESSVLTNVEFFEPGTDTASFNQLTEVEIQGTASAGQPQKSLEISAKGALGNSHMRHPVFPDLPFEEYKRLVLRNGGQDWCVLQFRDEFATSLLADLSDIDTILQKPALYQQAWRPAVAYLNGRYWGIHNVRERMNRFYVQQHFGWKEGEFDLVENYGDAASGDSASWFQLFNYLWQTDGFDNDSLFETVKQQIDYQNYIDYCVFNVYLDNVDWPGKNVRRFRHRDDNGKWRWMTYDLDFTFGLFQLNGGWNTGDASPDALARLLDGSSQTWPNPDWATVLFRRCWQNAGFRRDFANRMADMLNTAFVPSRVSSRLDMFRQLYEPEITRHYERWWFGNFDATWLNNIEIARQFAFARPDFVRQEIISGTAEAIEPANLTVDVFPPAGGRVVVNTVRPGPEDLPWTGIYFSGVPVPVKAVAAPGYVFSGWSPPVLGQSDSIGVMVDEALTLVAHFELADTTTTATKDTDASMFRVYPNPLTDWMIICGGEKQVHPALVQLLNGMGESVCSERVNPQAGGHFYLKLPDLPTGVYLLKIRPEGEVESALQIVLVK